MDTFRSLLPKFKQAIENEISFIQDKFKEQKIFLGDGKLDSKSDSSFFYEFETVDELTIPEDSPIKIIHENVSLNGTLARTNGNKIYIELSDYFGEIIKDVTLVNDPSSFLKRLLKQFESFEKGEISLNTTVFDRLLANPNSATAIEYIPRKYVNELLNEKQKEAVKQSIGNNFHFIWGPPGTGKTFSIAEIIYQLLKAGKKVLISSNTHKAVDGALQKLLINSNKSKSKYFDDSDILKNLYENQQILRLGGKRDKENKELYGDLHISMDDLIEKKSEQFNFNIGKLKKEISTNQSEISEKNELLEFHEIYINYEDKNHSTLISIEELNNKEKELQNHLDENRKILIEKEEKQNNLLNSLTRAKERENNIVALGKLVKKHDEILTSLNDLSIKTDELEDDKKSLHSRKLH